MPRRTNIQTSILNGYHSYWTWVKMNLQEEVAEQAGTALDWYMLMEAYFLNNGLYDVLRDFWGSSVGIPKNIKSIRNPAYRAVQFHSTHIWPGALPDALPIVTDNPRIIEPIQDIWTWSNWGTKKQLAARWAAMYGDMFIKVGHKESLSILTKENGNQFLEFDKPSRVIMSLIEPKHVREMDYDQFGVLTWIRIDVPSSSRLPNGDTESYTHVEVWDLNGVRVWRDDQNHAGVDLDQLGVPSLTLTLEQLKLDFIPIVWQPFIDLGKGRGLNCFGAALEKIDEANRMASRLHQMIFRYDRPLWALESNHVDQVGAPLPPPRVGVTSSDSIEIGDDTVMPLPGNTKLSALVPALDYSAVVQTLTEQMNELEADLPELTYYNMRQYSGELSGKAIQLRLSAAVDKLLEARGSLEEGLQRAHMMALTIGASWSIWEEDLGTFANGDFQHQFAERQVIPLSEFERSQIFQTYRSGELPLESALRFAGKSEDQIDDVTSEVSKAEKKEAKALSQAVLDAQRAMNQNPDEGDEEDVDATGIESGGASPPVPATSG